MGNITKIKSICAIDPGKTTGVCCGRATIRSSGIAKLVVAKSLEIPWNQRFYQLEELLTGYWWDHIVCEDFRLYRTHSRDQINSRFPSSQLIGLIEYFAWKGGVPIHFQMAADRKRTKVLEEHIEAVGGLTRNGNPASQHRWDSYQHMRYFVVLNAKKLYKEGE